MEPCQQLAAPHCSHLLLQRCGALSGSKAEAGTGDSGVWSAGMWGHRDTGVGTLEWGHRDGDTRILGWGHWGGDTGML